jgi:hypothetical protein
VKKVALLIILVVLFALYAFQTKDQVSSCVMPGSASATVQGTRFARRMGELVDKAATAEPPSAEDLHKVVDGVKRTIRMWVVSWVLGANGEKVDPQILKLEEADDERRLNSPLCSDLPDDQDCPPPGVTPGNPPFDPKTASLSLDQSEPRRITAIAVQTAAQHNLPPRAALVAVTAGLVESGMRNLNYGDRDSLGWLQQRPSAGWGTAAQVRDPRLAAEAFYGVAEHTHNRGLVDIPNWESRPVGEVAQAVQVSAFPDRYAARIRDAQRLLAAVGTQPGCADPADPGGKRYSLGAVKPHVAKGANLLGHMFGVGTIGGVRADALPDHPSGLAIDLMTSDLAQGQRIADYAKAHATQLGVAYIIWNRHIWSVQRDREGWRAYTGTSNPHTDHVHITFTAEVSA